MTETKSKKPAAKAATKSAAKKPAAKAVVKIAAKGVAKVASKVAVKAPAKAKAIVKLAAKEPLAKPPAVKKPTLKKTVAKKATAKVAVAKKAVAKKAVAKKAATKAAGKRPAASGLPVRTLSAGEKLKATVLKAMDDLKAKDVVTIDVRNRTSITDYLVVASGTSTRHVKSIADSVVKACKEIGQPPIGVEGEREAEWVLVDAGDCVVHVMLPKAREFYALERLWSAPAES